MDKRFIKIMTDFSFERLLLLLMAVAFLFLILAHDVAASENQYPGIMRFHVIANSDTHEDQALKLKVRDYVLEKLQMELVDVSEENMRKYIEDNLNRIEGWAKEALVLNNSSYGCSASVGIRHIPAKTYDDLYFPEGNYEALTITIGQGKGQNWWCVVFPPLCLIDGEDSPYSDKLDMSSEEKLELKSKIVEILEESNSSEERGEIDISITGPAITNILKGIYENQLVDAFLLKNG